MKFIRITQDNDDAIRELVDTYQALVCKEGPDNEKNCRRIHYHILLDSDLTDNGLRKQIYKYFNIPLDDQGQKSVAFTQVKDIEGVKRYICKGLDNTKPEIVINTMDVNVDKYYNDYWDIFASLKRTGERERKEAKSRTQEFMDYFRDNYSKETRKYYVSLTLSNICDIMVAYYKDNGYPMPSKWQGSQLIRTCYVFYSDQKDINENMRMYYDAY